MRTVKLGLSLRSKAQQAERISCRGQWWLIISDHGSTLQTRKLSEHWDVCEPRQTLLTEGLDAVRTQECPVLGMFTSPPQLQAQAKPIPFSSVLFPVLSLLSPEYNNSLEAAPSLSNKQLYEGLLQLRYLH